MSTTNEENKNDNLAKDLSDPNLDKVEEYFKTKELISNLRRDLKDLLSQMDKYKELKELKKKAKSLKEEIQDDENILSLHEKISSLRERSELLKELIRIELLEDAKEEVERNGKKLKIVPTLKEVRNNETKKTKGKFKK